MFYDSHFVKIKEFRQQFGEYRVEVVHANLTYRGWAPKGSLTSDQVWIIEREALAGQASSFAQAGNNTNLATQIWDNRATLFSSEPWGVSLCTSLDGVNDNINFGDNLNYERTNTFSFSTWAYFDTVAVAQTLWSKRSSTGTAAGVQFNILSNGRLEANLVSTVTTNHLRVQMVAAILAQTRYHVCWTYDGTSTAAGLRLYLNGTLTTLSTITANLTASILTATQATFGTYASAQYFDGRALETTFWNATLTGSEVSEIYNGGVYVDPRVHTKSANLTNYYQGGTNDTFPTWNDTVGTVDGTMTNMVSSAFTRTLP